MIRYLRPIRYTTLIPLFIVALVLACNDSSSPPSKVAQVQPHVQPQQSVTPAHPSQSENKKSIVWPPQSRDDVKVDLEGMLDSNYYLLLDTSGSMDGQKLEIAKEAVKSFVESVPQNANLGFGILGADVEELVTLGKNTKDKIIGTLLSLRAGGRTPLGNAITNIGYEKLTAQAQKQLGYGEYHLVIITDGEATDISETVKIVNFILDNTPIVIHTIGFQIGQQHCLNQPGRTIYKTASDLKSLREALASVLAEAPEFDATFE